MLTALSGAVAAGRGRDRPARERAPRPALGHQPPRGRARPRPSGSLDTYNILAGLVPVTGPGIRVTITETEGEVDARLR